MEEKDAEAETETQSETESLSKTENQDSAGEIHGPFDRCRLPTGGSEAQKQHIEERTRYAAL